MKKIITVIFILCIKFIIVSADYNFSGLNGGEQQQYVTPYGISFSELSGGEQQQYVSPYGISFSELSGGEQQHIYDFNNTPKKEYQNRHIWILVDSDTEDNNWLTKKWMAYGRCIIKGNVSYTTGEKIYHIPGWKDYESTVIDEEYGERWFCTEWEAYQEGWRAPYYMDRPSEYPNPYKK